MNSGEVRAGQGAAGESHAQGPGAVVGPSGDPFDPVEVVAGFGGGARDLEHHEVARDTTPLVNFLSGGAGDVVGDEDDAGVDALARSRCWASVKFMTSPA